MAIKHAIDDIADRTAQQKRQGQTKQSLASMHAQQIKHHQRGHNTQPRKEPALPAASIGQEGKCGAGIVHADQIEEGGHGQSFTQLESTHHRNLGQLV